MPHPSMKRSARRPAWPMRLARERSRMDAEMGAALSAIAAGVAADWQAMRLSDLQFWQRDFAQLIIVALVAGAAARADGPCRDRSGGQDGITSCSPPSCARPSPSRLAWTRHIPVVLFGAGSAVCRAGRCRSVYVAGGGKRDLPGPAHRADDRRLRQHADVVQGRNAEHPQRSAAGVFHHRCRGRSASSSCGGRASTATSWR